MLIGIIILQYAYVGIYGEGGFQVLGTHYSLGPVFETGNRHLLLNARAGYQVAMVSYPSYPGLTYYGDSSGFYPACIPVQWEYTFHGWVGEGSVGWCFWNEERRPLSYVALFVGASIAHTWVMSHQKWRWEDSWAVHAGVILPLYKGKPRNEIAQVYPIGWLDVAFVQKEPIESFTLMTPWGLGLNLWLLSWGQGPEQQEEEP